MCTSSGRPHELSGIDGTIVVRSNLFKRCRSSIEAIYILLAIQAQPRSADRNADQAHPPTNPNTHTELRVYARIITQRKQTCPSTDTLTVRLKVPPNACPKVCVRSKSLSSRTQTLTCPVNFRDLLNSSLLSCRFRIYASLRALWCIVAKKAHSARRATSKSNPQRFPATANLLNSLSLHLMLHSYEKCTCCTCTTST